MAFTGILAADAVHRAAAGRHPGGAHRDGRRRVVDNTFVKDLPLFIAFLVLADFTFVSGLRAPALISFIKDTLVYVMVIVAIFYIPTRLGGWGHIFGDRADAPHRDQPGDQEAQRHVHPDLEGTGSTQLDFATLALGSAVALFLYPHTITGTLASKRRTWSSATRRCCPSTRSCSA